MDRREEARVVEDPRNFAPERPTRTTRNPAPAYSVQKLDAVAGHYANALATMQASRRSTGASAGPSASSPPKKITPARYAIMWGFLVKTVYERNCGTVVTEEEGWQERLLKQLNNARLKRAQLEITSDDLRGWLKNGNLAKLVKMVERSSDNPDPNWRSTIEKLAAETEPNGNEPRTVEARAPGSSVRNSKRKRSTMDEPVSEGRPKKRQSTGKRSRQPVAAFEESTPTAGAVGLVSGPTFTESEPVAGPGRSIAASRPRRAALVPYAMESDDGSDSDTSFDPATVSSDTESEGEKREASPPEVEQNGADDGSFSTEQMEMESSDAVPVSERSGEGDKSPEEEVSGDDLPLDLSCVRVNLVRLTDIYPPVAKREEGGSKHLSDDAPNGENGAEEPKTVLVLSQSELINVEELQIVDDSEPLNLVMDKGTTQLEEDAEQNAAEGPDLPSADTKDEQTEKEVPEVAMTELREHVQGICSLIPSLRKGTNDGKMLNPTELVDFILALEGQKP